MKLSLAQALATVLDINLSEDKKWFSRNGINLCRVTTGLPRAVIMVADAIDLNTASNFAVFPISSNREEIYMSTERELLRQEMTLEAQMWTKMGVDPRELVTQIMLQLRECATNVVAPTQFQMHMQRVSCLAVASLQWIGDWISKMRIQQAVLRTQPIEVPKVVEIAKEQLATEEPATLFGAGGVGALKVVLSPDDKIEQATD